MYRKNNFKGHHTTAYLFLLAMPVGLQLLKLNVLWRNSCHIIIYTRSDSLILFSPLKKYRFSINDKIISLIANEHPEEVRLKANYV